MLKVVGASWVKTRLSTFILFGATLLAVGSFFIAEIDRPQFDGTFCATAYWSRQSGFHVEYWKQGNDLNKIPKGVARICYKDSTLENGWSQLEIETQKGYPDWVQSFSSGLLEGTLTWSKIYYQWSNAISSPCELNELEQNYCTWLRDILSNNYKFIKRIAENRAKYDHYWHQIRLFYYQLEGLEAGWKKGAKRARSELEIPSVDFLLMNAAGDIQDLRAFFDNFIMHSEKSSTTIKKNVMPSATMIAKLIRDGKTGLRFLFGHSSVGNYLSNLRMYKRYKFHYHLNLESKGNVVPGSDIIFTSFPGVLGSTDDFYIIKGRHIYSLIAGVRIKNNDIKLWENIQINDVIPLIARVMAASRIAQTRQTWVKIMARYPTTGLKQWAVFDIRKLNSFDFFSNTSKNEAEFVDTSRSGFLWIVEQLPGRLHGEDVSDTFFANSSLWYTNGIPRFSKILKINDVPDDSSLFEKASNSNIRNLDTIKEFLKSQVIASDFKSEITSYSNIDIKTFSYTSSTSHSNFHSGSGPFFVKKPKFNDSDSKGIVIPESMLDATKIVDLEVIWDRRSTQDDIRALAKHQKQNFYYNKIDNLKQIRNSRIPNIKAFSPKWAWYD